MAKAVSERVQKRREALRAAGLRPVQIWLPNTRQSGFSEECLRQSRIISAAEADDDDLNGFLDAAFLDMVGSEA
nr:antitoxin MazE family protein [uncultured Shinella sp.]